MSDELIIKRSTHSDRLVRWLGRDAVESISEGMRDWYGPPIPVKGVPGAVFAVKGGGFVGPIKGGGLGSFADFAECRMRSAVRRWSLKQQRMAGTGFASISELIAALTSGQTAKYPYQKVGTTGVVAGTNSLWRVGNQPSAGAAAAAAPGGTVPTSATAGAIVIPNAPALSTMHLYRMDSSSSIAANTLLLYDRIFAVAKTMNSTGTEAVTGVPTRYQGSTPTNPDYAGGNFLFVECGTVLAATAHNWTVCTYTDQDGNTGATLPSLTGNSANIVNRIDHPTGQWFAPLAAGDYGIKALTQMQCSALVATGAIDFVIGHPLAFMTHAVANQWYIASMINDALNLQRIYDDACLALLETIKPAATATTYTGMVNAVYG